MAQIRKVSKATAKKTGPRKHSAGAAPTTVKRKFLVRLPNSEYRNREYLSEQEVNKVIAAAGAQGRHGPRDSALILLAYRHGLRVSELVSLRWDQIDLAQGLVYVVRLKNGIPSVHPLRGLELRALRRLQREKTSAAYVFVSERKAPLTPDAVRKIVLPWTTEPTDLTRLAAHAGKRGRVFPRILSPLACEVYFRGLDLQPQEGLFFASFRSKIIPNNSCLGQGGPVLGDRGKPGAGSRSRLPKNQAALGCRMTLVQPWSRLSKCL